MNSEISKIDLSHLRNKEHQQFFDDFLKHVKGAEAIIPRLQPQFGLLETLHRQEQEALMKIRKSDLTHRICEADRKRDAVFRGMSDANRSALNHFDPVVCEAARRLQIVFKTYGNVAEMSLTSSSAMLQHLLNELTRNHAADMATVGLEKWPKELYALNGEVRRLLQSRDEENALRTGLVAREVRRQVDGAYRAVAALIDALMVVEGDSEDAPYAAFIHELNTTIERYKQALAVRRGRSKASASRAERGENSITSLQASRGEWHSP